MRRKDYTTLLMLLQTFRDTPTPIARKVKGSTKELIEKCEMELIRLTGREDG